MSLRRSSRVASTSTPVALGNRAKESVAKYTKVEKKPAAAPKKRKSRASATAPAQQDEPTSSTDDANFVVPELPATPLPKKRKAASSAESPIKPPPLTPTPSGVGLITSSTSSEISHPLEILASLESRPAEPHATNAPLSTPGGSRVVAYHSSPVKPEDSSPVKKRKAKEVVPPDVGALKPATTNIDTLLKEAEAYLISVDPKLSGLIEKHHCKMFSPEGLREVVDPFTALASSIIGQQVSGQAAASIRKKFTALFEDTHPAFPSPSQVIQKDLPTLRTAGLSQRKAEYISGLAEKFASGELTAQMLVSASDAELIEKLVAVRGLGRWSVEMFACFGLKRMDVFSTGDLGVQ
ncbi:DNA-3-methyladenine glycosylase-like protein [Phaeosphaeria sp. MPI-PUGE-AT-0046c]|nr:DNA-3-methyladenine glycosylase-like protein [Phaeosphaeria sp. MPI-PUGE-AT-0046c]